VTASERTSPYDRRRDIADKPVSEVCFNRFLAVLREIASGEDVRALTSLEAQKLAREVLTDCGYSWPGQATDAGAKQLGGAMGPEPSTAETTVRQHLKEQLRQLKKLNGAAASLGGC
jgi:hypothetical protein